MAAIAHEPRDRRALRDTIGVSPRTTRRNEDAQVGAQRSAIDASVGPGDVEVVAPRKRGGPRRRGVLRAPSPPFSGPASPDNLVNEPDRLKGEFVLPQWKKWDKWCFGEGSPAAFEKKISGRKKTAGPILKNLHFSHFFHLLL